MPSLQNLLNSTKLVFREAVIRLELDPRLHPELGFSLSRLNMHVHPALFTREEKDTDSALPEDCRAHAAPAPNGQRVSGE